MKKILLAWLLALIAPFSFGQSYPSPTYQNLLVNGTFNSTGLVTCNASTNAVTWTGGSFGCNTAINAATLGGATFAAPGPIGSTTASTGAFTTLSATTPNPSLLYLNGGTGAVSRTYSSKMGDYISIADFNAKCDGVTNDTTAIQNAWNEGQIEQKNVRISGVGTGVCVITSLTMPIPVSQNGGQSVIFGDNPQSTALVSNVTGSNCAINISPTTATGSLLGKIGGFSLINSNASPSGYGICLNNVADFTLSNYQVTNFNYGEYAVGSLWINNDHCLFTGNNLGIIAISSGVERPNNWNIGPDCLFHSNNQGAIQINNGAVINVYGNDFEHNGTVNGSTIFGTIWMDGNPIDGTKGLTMWGNYIEDNGYIPGQGTGTGFSVADVIISDNGQSYSGVHHIYDNLFNRTIAGTSTNNIWLDNSTSGTGTTTLRADANAFNEDFTPGAGTSNILINNAGTNNWSLSCNDNQVGHPTQEMQFVPCKPKQLTSPGWTLVDGTYHQFGTVIATTAGAAVTFPVACPNAIMNLTMSANNGNSPQSLSSTTPTLTGFTAYASANTSVMWTAVCR